MIKNKSGNSYRTCFVILYILTCLTLQVCITRCTLTQVVVNLIYTGTAVLTGITGTLVNIFKKDYSKCICEISSGQ